MWALDFNVDPMCSVVAQMDGDEVRVLDEIVLSRASTHEACEEFRNAVSGARGGAGDLRGCDGARMQTAGTTDYRDFAGVFAANGRTARCGSRCRRRIRRCGTG